MTNQEIQDKCHAFAKSIGEHCSAVLVVVSVPGECACESGIFSTGAGDFHERVSLAEDFVKWDMAERVAHLLCGNSALEEEED